MAKALRSWLLAFPVLAVDMTVKDLLRLAETVGLQNPSDDLLRGVPWPVAWPLTARDLQRMDETDDAVFYSSARLVKHIDDSAIRSIKDYYQVQFQPSSAVLDICSSWVSHFPEMHLARAVGLGMNAEELAQNQQLTEFVVKDLNKDPSLPFHDNDFDTVVNVVSVDYLAHPLEVFRDIFRVLKPGGMAIMSFSNRFFQSKAIKLWLEIGEIQRCQVVSWYFKFAGFGDITAKDLTSSLGHDPVYVVQGVKPVKPQEEL
ncbi:unnamed protein product [Effrenium voratum]|uniref:Methyltransferase type 11 domain-containing protein n=2 Tax=Effrenium voratum TaxID=2562239 RepID=A0AA36JMK6_9DINO|nr:unnamed protein product [Effrenium voratum]CAJ1407743.1 unnamed protein product [Effrenium voratum]CAJ1423352.1 unnamed protein product [Effrenium voratum]